MPKLKQNRLKPDTTNLGDNPYRGLLAFRETDGERFFGRETQIEQLWQKFCHLHEDKSTVRVLPIYGPIGFRKIIAGTGRTHSSIGQKNYCQVAIALDWRYLYPERIL
jgi:hypothetical protein